MGQGAQDDAAEDSRVITKQRNCQYFSVRLKSVARFNVEERAGACETLGVLWHFWLERLLFSVLEFEGVNNCSAGQARHQALMRQCTDVHS
eukprot:559229-Pelagomonas_calceolata.AAC.6